VRVWAYDSDKLGPPPPGVEVVAEPGPDVEFVVPRWEDLPALDEIPALRVVQVLSAGVDWIADRVPAGVTLCSARGARDRAMAEWVMAAILADAKGAREVAEQQARRHWELVKLGDASNLRVLVLGFGSIGRALATMLAAFDCEAVGVARRARDGIHGSDELPILLPEADVVVNPAAAHRRTQGSIGARELAAMREGALYVNAGRGATTDTAAPSPPALQAGRIRAVLDVVDPEPLPSDIRCGRRRRDDQPAQRGRHAGRRSRGMEPRRGPAAPLRRRRGARGNVVSDGY
jgi:phosphoglycerate dehydrogenase-like enzyme